jgi:hypothetical protein
MNESWNKHIQPILDSWEWDHFSSVWDPFLAKYPKFSAEQRMQVENALVTCAFDINNEKLAIKALGIAEILQTNHFATQRLLELMRGEFRKQFEALRLESDMSYYYILAFSSFQLVESIPYLKSVVEQLEKSRVENILAENDGTRHSYKELMRACVISLSRLCADEGLTFLIHFRSAQEKQDIEKLIKDFHGKVFNT